MRCTLFLARRFLLIPVLLVALSLTGCVSSGYQRAGSSTPLAVPLGWSTEAKPVGLTLQTVVVYQGPGSWKANAYWDEYVVTLRNHGSEPATIDSAALMDFQGQFVVPGENPWSLEKRSRDGTDQLNRALGNIVHVSAGIGVPFASGVSSVAALDVLGIIGGASAPVVFLSGFVVMPVAIGTSVYRNVSNKHEIEREFARRRITFPLTLAPGQELTGSVFFPVTPGPARLEVKFHGSEQIGDLDLHLPQLAQLHFAPPAAEGPVIPLRPFRRDGKYWLTLTADTNDPSGYIAANGQERVFAPANIAVEVDAGGHLVEDLTLVATAMTSRSNTPRLSVTKTYVAGQIPPARMEFTQYYVRETYFAAPRFSATTAAARD